MSARDAAVRIRRASAEDVRGMRAIYASIVEGTPISFEEAVPSEQELARRLAQREVRTPSLVCVEGKDERLLGYAYAGPFRTRAAYRWTAESTVYVHEAARRRGVGRALMAALLGLLRLQGYHLVVAGITLPNPGSVQLHEALGFEPVGTFREVGRKLGAWHDVGFWQLQLDPNGTDAPGAAPLDLAAVLALPAARSLLATSSRGLSPGNAKSRSDPGCDAESS